MRVRIALYVYIDFAKHRENTKIYLNSLYDVYSLKFQTLCYEKISSVRFTAHQLELNRFLLSFHLPRAFDITC